MDYIDQLNHDLWKSKRSNILIRDVYRCQHCFNKSLIHKFRVSFIGVGLTINKLLYLIFDKESDMTYRCSTSYEKRFMSDLLKYNSEHSIIALTVGDDVFCKLIATIITDTKIDFSPLESITDKNSSIFKREQQKLQEAYLFGMSDDLLKNLRWIDTKGLHIHHKYYQNDKLAWNYPDDALIALCWSCHEELHKDTKIEIRDVNGNVIGNKPVCSRCHGAGWFPEFSHVQNGVCFRCNGFRFES